MSKKHILILEPDADFADRLAKMLNEMGTFEVTIVSNARNACLHLIKEPQELAFVPIIRGDKLIRALRAAQRNLRIVLVTPSGDQPIPEVYAGEIQGVLLKSHLDADLDGILEEVLSHPFPMPEGETSGGGG